MRPISLTNSFSAGERVTGAEGDVEDDDVITEELQKALDSLERWGRVLVSAHPGGRRKSFLNELRRHFQKKGFTVNDPIHVGDWDRKGPKDCRDLVLFANAFGDVRLDLEQYYNFYKHKMYSINTFTTKLVFVLYPHVLLELEQYDPASDRPLLDTMEVVELEQDPLVSPYPYVDLLMRMLRHPKYGLTMGALLSLTMQGQGCFLNNPRQALPHLQRLGFPEFSDVHLEEYASLLQGFLLADSGRGFVSRVVYDAAGVALGRSYLETVVLQVCDVKFLVQHVCTEHTTTDSSLVTGRRPDNGRLLMQRMCDDIMKGCLPEMIQHPCLHSPQFLQEFEAFCKKQKQLQHVMSAVDQQHNLPLLYWSVWGSSPCLTEWCLSLMMGHTHDDSVSGQLLLAAFAAALLRRCRGTDIPRLTTRLRNEFASVCKTTFNDKLKLPIPSSEQRYTEDLDMICKNIQLHLNKSQLCYLGNLSLNISNDLLTIRLMDDAMELALLCKHSHLALRLLTDRRVDDEDSEGSTLLHLAADTGHLEVIKLAVHSGASLTVKNKARLTPPQLAARRMESSSKLTKPTTSELFTACTASDMAQLKILLCHNAGVNDKRDSGQTPLHFASKSGQTDVAALLIDLGADVNATDRLKQTPLHAACTEEHLDTAKLLLQRGAAVNARDIKGIDTIPMQHSANVSISGPNGMTALHLACKEGGADFVELLLRHDADVNIANANGATALHLACYKGYADVVELLLQHNADVNISVPYSVTSLHLASDKGHADVVELLLQHGADVKISGQNGLTPLHCACNKGHADVVEFLLQHSTDVNISGPYGTTPLHHACGRGHAHVVELILQHNADMNISVPDSMTPLHLACYEGHADVVELLLQHSADVNISGPDGMTPLNYACNNGHADVVKLLLRHNADVNISRLDGVTPLHMARCSGYTNVVHLLLQQWKSKCLLQHRVPC